MDTTACSPSSTCHLPSGQVRQKDAPISDVNRLCSPWRHSILICVVYCKASQGIFLFLNTHKTQSGVFPGKKLPFCSRSNFQPVAAAQCNHFPVNRHFSMPGQDAVYLLIILVCVNKGNISIVLLTAAAPGHTKCPGAVFCFRQSVQSALYAPPAFHRSHRFRGICQPGMYGTPGQYPTQIPRDRHSKS